MINGIGVSGKYNVIIDGHKAELWKNITPETLEAKREELMTFRAMIRECSMSDFNDWYELYKGLNITQPRRKRGIIEDLQNHDD